MEIKVVSWNIWQGKHLPEIIDFLQGSNADIIGLQEVIEKDSTNTAQIIADKLGYQCAYYQAIDKTRLGFPQGNAILSRYSIKNSVGHLLSDPDLYQGTAETEPRVAVEMTLSIASSSLMVFTTHLAYSHMFQESQFRDLQVKNLIRLLPGNKAVLMGDFNSHPDSRYMKDLNQVMRNADPELAKPTWTVYPFDYEGFKETKLKYRLDYIFTTKDLSTHDFEVGRSMGSDHLPVSAIIEFAY